MQKVKVLGGGCSNCMVTYNLIKDVVHEMGVEVEIEKVEDIQEIMSYDVMSTPGVVIEETVVHRGGVPSRKTVELWFS
ncbi:MAG: thioredoxin family protein [Deltaproteobacteria bacterium]|jgi:small redox-active disulfide protein 2|nr:thioredoxin family protein [Candidatus Neomarinimicrobiota bacterium]MBT7888369.1 thioredoxin family protein [Deltaproteobacteria bacterium]MBT4362510.1 thioredoxin family protein [Candidatus Neomarinimicrobiota bacterium]MBT4714488.1 thioredoxin family protein [Candidatus Neomarinimicrobiota bacterium]MBT4946527.1 thioredoxin family protein [Candidatus Neomarinimicrobiota bacterium]